MKSVKNFLLQLDHLKQAVYRGGLGGVTPIFILPTQTQTFHFTRHITPKRATSLQCSSLRHSAKATPLSA